MNKQTMGRLQVILGKPSNARHKPIYRQLADRTGLPAPIIEHILKSMFDFIERAKQKQVSISIGRFMMFVPILSCKLKRPSQKVLLKSNFKKHISDISDDPLNYYILKEMYENGKL